jgi:hypothetical protein
VSIGDYPQFITSPILLVLCTTDDFPNTSYPKARLFRKIIGATHELPLARAAAGGRGLNFVVRAAENVLGFERIARAFAGAMDADA